MREAPEDNDSEPEHPADPQADAQRRLLVTRLFTEHNRALISFLTARLHCGQEALDVAQEAYVRMLQLDRPVSFHKAYLFKVAQNLATDRVRRRIVRERLSGDDVVDLSLLQPVIEPERAATAQLELESVRERLSRLPYNCRFAFVQHVLLDRPVTEVAARMKRSERMVRLYIVRALAQCRGEAGAGGNDVPDDASEEEATP